MAIKKTIRVIYIKAVTGDVIPRKPEVELRMEREIKVSAQKSITVGTSERISKPYRD